MIGKEELFNFKKMWTWLSGYPAHDREYYMKHVMKLDETWLRSCPLANRDDESCDGCLPLWNSENGTLCTDGDSPLNQWLNTGRDRPDDRCYYASHVAVIAMNALRAQGEDPYSADTPAAQHIHSRLQG